MANILLRKQLIFFLKAGLEYSMKKVCVRQNFKWGKVHLLKGVCTESQHEESVVVVDKKEPIRKRMAKLIVIHQLIRYYHMEGGKQVFCFNRKSKLGYHRNWHVICSVFARWFNTKGDM